MIEYLTRSAWTDTAPGGATLTAAKLKGNACHYPASGDITMAGLSREQVASRLRGWRDYHVNTRGWSDIGYQVAIDGAGRVWTLRGIGRVPAAHASTGNPDANEEYGATLWVLGDNERPTPAAIQAYRDFRTHVWLQRWANATQVLGHRQVPGAQTSCPGDRIIQLIASGALTQSAPPPTTGGWDMATADEVLAAVNAFRAEEKARYETETARWKTEADRWQVEAGRWQQLYGALPTAFDVDRLAAAIVAKLPADQPVNQATVEAGVRAVLKEGVGS